VRADPVDTEDTEPKFEATAIHKVIQGSRGSIGLSGLGGWRSLVAARSSTRMPLN
jgi:hypothetical protein